MQSVFNCQSAEVLRESFPAVFTARKSVFVKIEKWAHTIAKPITTYSVWDLKSKRIQLDEMYTKNNIKEFDLSLKCIVLSTAEQNLAINPYNIFNIAMTFCANW